VLEHLQAGHAGVPSMGLSAANTASCAACSRSIIAVPAFACTSSQNRGEVALGDGADAASTWTKCRPGHRPNMQRVGLAQPALVVSAGTEADFGLAVVPRVTHTVCARRPYSWTIA
jgi:hypothetical protein